LEPHPGQPHLDPREAIDRLRDEFALVDADQDEGADYVGDIIARLIELNAPKEIIDNEVAAQQGSYYVIVADGMFSESCLRLLFKPEEGPLISYSSGEEEEELRPLVERCANALNYCIVLI